MMPRHVVLVLFLAASVSCSRPGSRAAAPVTAGEFTDPVMIGVACCYLIRACEQVRDYDRAAQWSARVREACTWPEQAIPTHSTQ